MASNSQPQVQDFMLVMPFTLLLIFQKPRIIYETERKQTFAYKIVKYFGRCGTLASCRRLVYYKQQRWHNVWLTIRYEIHCTRKVHIT